MFYKGAQRVKRGMVFWYDPFPDEKDKNFHYITIRGKAISSYIIAGKRPWVVVSSDFLNSTSCVCSICPITSADKFDSPSHVLFEWRGKTQTILTEQITTVDIARLDTYDCVLSESLMLDIDKAMAFTLGMQAFNLSNLPDLEGVVKSIENVIESAIKTKVANLKNEIVVPNSIVSDTANRMTNMINSMLMGSCDEKGQPIEKSAEVGKKETKHSAIQKFNARYGTDYKVAQVGEGSYKVTEGDKVIIQPPVKKVLSDEKETTRRKHRSWSEDDRKNFMADIEAHSIDYVMKKYGLSSRAEVSRNKYRFKNMS